MSIKVGIIGGTGYTGVELLRLLHTHDKADVIAITSRSEAGRAASDLFPALRGITDIRFSTPDDAPLHECDVVFCAAPNGVAMTHAPALLDAGVTVIDLSADFRLRDAQLWSQWYGMTHSCPELLDSAVYGLPELNREAIAGARLIANPGCYPTTVQLALAPLLESGVADPSTLIADAKSGVSGAGRKASVASAFSECADSLKAYNVSGHRHGPEIAQQLDLLTGGSVNLVFVPHLTPMIRGIHATCYARLTDPSADLQALFENRYQDEPFVDVMPTGSHPDTRSVRGSNMVRIACHRPGDGATAVVLAVEDNLVKGAAGQAVQNMNLALGLDESTGLLQPPLLP